MFHVSVGGHLTLFYTASALAWWELAPKPDTLQRHQHILADVVAQTPQNLSCDLLPYTGVCSVQALRIAVSNAVSHVDSSLVSEPAASREHRRDREGP
eukprot:CAMPEP_0204565506 /NCGR_PEP_ID=MMETSP0661-20131031/35515_1 /ASSEMBLY_ACC=CAM_ASM_000606 /TAXON_ID=109239 /ORGANISM="Alexandrium margalefi, Strain AMGDE01CS-322" /LENGTH=97 /DNA_ID=CAMNT_0051573259 /DNA_START=33 /DNA_END=323 /DNA_ORIENTATION=-